MRLSRTLSRDRDMSRVTMITPSTIPSTSNQLRVELRIEFLLVKVLKKLIPYKSHFPVSMVYILPSIMFHDTLSVCEHVGGPPLNE